LADTAVVAEVDSDDDARDRWVVRRYGYDDVRRERRWTDVVAFDNAQEAAAFVDRAGTASPGERWSAVLLEAGHRLGAARRRNLRRLLRRRGRPPA
jgi:hypothetical protein